MDKFNQLRIKKSIFIERGDSMTTIKLKVIDENIEFTSSPPIYSGGINTISTLFDFGDIWESFTKTAVFYREITKPYQVVLKDDECLIPHEVMTTAGRIYIGVFGVKGDKVKTSEVVYYDIGIGVMTHGSISEPSDDIWQQILAELGNIRELAEQMKLDQENFKTKVTKKQNDFETTITNKQNNFEMSMTERQEDFEQRVENKTGYTKEEADERFIPTALQGTYTTDLSEEYKGVASDYGAEILKIEGKSEQASTNGYQLFDASKLPTKTQGGATVTNNGDGSFTISGSGDLTEVFLLNYVYSQEETQKLLKKGTLKINGLSDIKPYFSAGLVPLDGATFISDKKLNYETTSIEITEEDLKNTRFRIVFYGTSGNAIKGGTIKPMLYQDGDGIWEPFTGGIPSPNPNYPQEINNALDEPLVSVGRNLFDANGLKLGGAKNLKIEENGYKISLESNGGYRKAYYEITGNVLNALKGNSIKLKYSEGTVFDKNSNLQIIIKRKNEENKFYGVDRDTFETKAIDITEDVELIKIELLPANLSATLESYQKLIVVGLRLYDVSNGEVEWEPYKYAETNLNFQRMCSVPSGTCDTYENGVSTQRIGLYGFNGHSREDWKIDKTYTDCTRFYIVKNDIKRRNDYTNSIMCNRLKTLTSHTTKDKGISSYTNSDYPNQNWIYVNGFNEFATVEQFKEWLGTHPINIQYELETPIVLEVDKPIVPTFYPYTNIFQSDDVKAKIQYELRSKVDEVEKDLKEHNHDDRYFTENEINTKLNSYKIKGDFAVINGNINLTNGEGSVDVNYPSGFNKDNCVCIAAGFAYQTAIGYIYDGYMDGGFEVRFKTDRMTCIAYTAGQDAGPSGAKPIRIVLMKV